MLPDLSAATAQTGAAQSGSLQGMTVTIQGLPLEPLSGGDASREAHLSGTLTLTLQGEAPTLNPSEVATAVSGTGTITIANPRLRNLNVLREVFQRMSMLPGLVEKLETRLPAAYQAKLAEPDTVLAPIDVTMQMDHGVMHVPQLQLGTDVFRLSGGGTVGVDGAIRFPCVLQAEPAFSAALIQSVAELQLLANAQGEVELPLIVQGQLPRVGVVPDLNAIASKLITTKTEELLGTLLQNALQRHLEKHSASP